MNIKEIANLAEVSISTVSKIVNGKDANISRETRERVIKIVKEYNYTPYATIKNSSPSKSLILGVLLNGAADHNTLLKSVIEYSRENGYSSIVCSSNNTNEELKNITMLCTRNIDGVLWDKVDEHSSKYEKYLQEKGIPICIIDCNSAPSENNLCFDYKQLGYNAAKKLVQFKHQKIGCLVENGGIMSQRFLQGYKQCLYENKIPFDAQLCQIWDDSQLSIDMFLHSVTGVICFNAEIAGEVYRQAYLKNYKIPKDLSVVGLSDRENIQYMIPKLSTIKLPFYPLGEFTSQRLIAKVEKNKFLEVRFNTNVLVDDDSSVDVPITLRNKKIVVVGALNMDTLVNVGCFPKSGETITAKSCAMIPGGKGVNQAIGAAKLGAEVYLIGRLGKDYEGSALYDSLNANNVNVQGVKTDTKLATGHAYIYVQSDGESSIVIYDGANQNLAPQDIETNAYMFENASFCLLQTEIHIDTVEYAAKIAKKYGVKVLLKPAAATSISDSLIENVDIFMPNKNEMNLLCSQKDTLEEQAQHFLDRGAKAVIVTLGHEGCYLRNGEHSLYFEAANFEPVDTTGAADAFAATLAVYLSRNYDIITSIKYATYAAGFSITRQGVPPALVDKSTLDLYLSDL